MLGKDSFWGNNCLFSKALMESSLQKAIISQIVYIPPCPQHKLLCLFDQIFCKQGSLLHEIATDMTHQALKQVQISNCIIQIAIKPG